MKTTQAEHVRSVIAALHGVITPQCSEDASPVGQRDARFITISRQAGAGGKTLGMELARELNQMSPRAKPWTVWDHELVEKVSAEHNIPPELVEALEDARHPWFQEFVQSFSTDCPPSDFKVYRRVALTIRALANAGRAVLVGRGSVFITAGMPGGVHVRLVAPLDFRIQRMAERNRWTPEEAAVRVREIDRNREAFYRRYWPNQQMRAETFTVTLNTAELSDRQMVECLIPILVSQAAERSAMEGVRGTIVAPPSTRRTGIVRGGAV